MNATEEINSQIAVINEESIKDKIYIIRGQQVMLDFDLADIYGYEVKRLNEQVKRNSNRFPEDFLFQLTRDEVELVKSQNATSRNTNLFSGQDGGRRKLPYAFTEQGIYMLATVLKGELAEVQSIALIRVFKKMKDYIAENQYLIGDKSLQALTLQTIKNANDISDIMAKIEDEMVKKSDLPEIIRSFGFSEAKCEYLILNGETVEAAIAYRSIYSQANESIYIIDNYIDIKTLFLLNDIKANVAVTIFSDNVGNRLRLNDLNSFSKEYSSVNIDLKKNGGIIHDRYIILDYGKTTEQIYLCGASSKDAGNKVTTISKMSDNTVFHPLINALKSNSSLVLK